MNQRGPTLFICILLICSTLIGFFPGIVKGMNDEHNLSGLIWLIDGSTPPSQTGFAIWVDHFGTLTRYPASGWYLTSDVVEGQVWYSMVLPDEDYNSLWGDGDLYSVEVDGSPWGEFSGNTTSNGTGSAGDPFPPYDPLNPASLINTINYAIGGGEANEQQWDVRTLAPRDLTITNVTVDGDDPSFYPAGIPVGGGDTVNIYFNATSVGAIGTGGTFNLTAWNCTVDGTPIDINDKIEVFLDLGPLNEYGNTSGPGYDTGMLTFSWTAPTLPGDYYINMTVDSEKDISEIDELNNTIVIHFIVGPDIIPIDIVVDDVSYPNWPQISPIILPAPGQWIHIAINLTNVGATTTGGIPFNVAFYNVSVTDYTQLDPAFYDSGFIFSDLDPGEIFLGGEGWWYAPAPGEFRINLTVDFGKTISELSETNNTYVLRILVGPDVAPTNVVANSQPLAVSPSQPVPVGQGQLIGISLNATNIGFSPTGTSIWVGFYNSTLDGGMLNQPFYNVSVPELNGSSDPGNSLMVPTGFWFSPSLAGVYYVTLYVDIANDTFEFDEINNMFVVCFLVGPDLTYTYVTVNGTPADLDDPSEIWYTGSGETILIGVNATNVGASPTGTGFSISFTNCTSSGVPIDPPFDTFVWGNLNDGETTPPFVANWIVPNFVGDLYVNITIDYLDDVSESVETNNTYILHFAVGPDLIPTNINVNGMPAPSQSMIWYVGPGEIITINANATNIGISGTGSDFNISLQNVSISGSAIIGDANLFNFTIPALGAGGDSGQRNWFWMAPIASGDFYVNITVDFGNTSVWEISEINNIFTIHFVVAADLIPTNVSVDGMSISSYPSETVVVYPGQAILIGANVSNIGLSSTGILQFNMTFWNSSAAGVVFGLPHFDSGLLGPLISGEYTNDFYFLWIAPSPDKPTDFYINITVDSTWAVPEWVEINNTYILHIRVDAPDLTPDKIEVEAAGGSVSIIYDEPYLLPISFVSEIIYVPLGNQVNITYTIGNIGGIDQITGTNVTAYNVSGIGGAPIDDPFFESLFDVVLLNSGETMSLVIVWPNPGAQGEYYFNISIDYNGTLDIGGRIIELSETNNTFTFLINVTSIPITTLRAGIPTYQPGAYWYVNSSTELNFTVTGPNPPLYTHYQVTDLTTGIIVEPWKNYTVIGTNFTMTWGEGTYLMEYNSTNAIGGVEPTRTRIIIVDDSPPQTSIIIGIPQYKMNIPDILNITSSTSIDLSAIDYPLGLSVAGPSNASGINGVPRSGIFYRIWNSDTSTWVTPWLEYTGSSFTISGADGNYSIFYNSTDNLIQIEPSKIQDIYLDNTGPDTTIDVGDPKYPNALLDWYVKSTTIFTLDATEIIGSGANISTIEYRITFIDGAMNSGWISGNSFDMLTAFMQGDGNYTIEFRARDNLGNLGLTGTMDIYVDDTPPSAVFNVGSPRHRNLLSDIWNITSTTPLNFTSEDGPGCGVNYMQFHIFNASYDSGWMTFSTDFTFSSILPLGASDGVYTIEYNVADYLGNDVTLTEDIYLDNTGPAPSVQVGNPYHTHPTNDYFVKSTTTYTLSLSEVIGSGPDPSTLEFRITYVDGAISSSWITGSSFEIVNSFMQGDGNYLLEFRGRDNLGNLGPQGSITVEVDDTPPVTTLNIGDPKHPTIISFPLNVTGSTPFNLTSTDGLGSGVLAIYYQINYDNLTNWNFLPRFTYSGNYFLMTGPEGNYSIRYWAVDNVLNPEAYNYRDIIVDNSPPVSSIEFLDPNYKANATSDIINITNYTPINITSQDGGVAPVGVDFIEYMVDDDFDLGNGNLTGWVTYSGLFQLTDEPDGDYMIYYHAADLLGNIEPINNITIILDSSPPETEFIIAGINHSTPDSLANDTWWIMPQTTLILSGEDQGNPPVGFNITEYWIDGTFFGTFDGYIEFDLSLLPNGSHILEFRSIDHLTNTESLNSKTIIVDDAGPDMDITSTEVTLPSPLPQVPSDPIIFTEDTDITIDAIDMGVPAGDEPSGVSYIQFMVIDPNDPTPSWQTISAGSFNAFYEIGQWFGNASFGYWHNNISFRAFDNLGWEGPAVTLWIYIEGDTEPPDPPVLTLKVEGDNILLEWSYINAVDDDINHYLIYRSPSKTDFDFRDTAIWVDTSNTVANGIDPLDDEVIPLRSTWNDTGIVTSFTEYYYIIRAVDQRGNIGYTSNIAGWVTMTFERGYSAFSLPLAPFEDISAAKILSNNVFSDDKDTLYRYDVPNQQWVGHSKDMPSFMDDFSLEMDESYMIYVDENEVSFTFTGATGTSIRYIEGFGDDTRFSGSLSITMIGEDDVELSWDGEQAPGADEFAIYRAGIRYGIGSLTDYELNPISTVSNSTTSWTDNNLSPGDYYYIVVTRSHGQDFSGTYAVGVRIIELSRGYESFSFALEPNPELTVGSFAIGELELDRDTIYYYDKESADWQGHPKLLPENINTGNVVMGSGYLVFTHGESTKVAVIGI